jgi:hypothetical protein
MLFSAKERRLSSMLVGRSVKQSDANLCIFLGIVRIRVNTR